MKRDPLTSKLMLAAGLLFLLLAARFNFLTDDAFISFRYARNWVEGHGLVWNPSSGSELPVEGYSNLGWVLLMGAAQAVGWAPETASRAISLLCGLLLLLLLARHLEDQRRQRPPGIPDGVTVGPSAAGAAGLLFLASAPPFVVWATGGLETMAFALALFASYAALERQRWVPACLWAGAAVLLRADGVAWVALATLASLTGRGAAWRPRAWVLLGALTVFAAQVLLRLQLYGDWLPNTVRAKVSWRELDGELRSQFLQRGFYYLGANLLAAPALLLALGVGARAWRSALPCALVVTGGLGYCVLVGGDFMAMGRFLVPTLPFLAALFAAGLSRWRRPALAHWIGLAAVALSLAAAFDHSPFPRSVRDRLHFRWNNRSRAVSEVEMWQGMRQRTEDLTRLGRALGLHTSPDEVATYGPVGAVGFYSRHVIHDTYGLTSRELLEHSTLGTELRSPGHDRRVAPEVLAQLPLTYLEASLAPVNAPLPKLPPGRRWHWERLTLDVPDGFPPGTELRLLRP